MRIGIMMFILMIIIGIVGYINWLFDYTKDFPECRFSGDPVLCVHVAKEKDRG